MMVKFHDVPPFPALDDFQTERVLQVLDLDECR